MESKLNLYLFLPLIVISFQVYIVGHMPPGSDERQFGANSNNGHTTYSEKNNLRYLRLIRKYSSIIQGQFFGHLHSDTFRIVYDDGKVALFSSAFSFCLPLCRRPLYLSQLLCSKSLKNFAFFLNFLDLSSTIICRLCLI